MADLTFDQIKPLLEQLIDQMPSAEVDRLRMWLNSESTLHTTPITPASNSENEMSWGESVVALVHEFNLDTTGLGWDDKDPETWVREHRQSQVSRRNPGWGQEHE